MVPVQGEPIRHGQLLPAGRNRDTRANSAASNPGTNSRANRSANVSAPMPPRAGNPAGAGFRHEAKVRR